MGQFTEITASRRTVLKGGTAAIALATVGTPIKMAFAADAVRHNLYAPTGRYMLGIYKTAVGKMKDAAINNPPQPTSWTFQAYIHSLPVDPTNPNSAGYKNGSDAFITKVKEIYGNPTPGTQKAAWMEAALKCWSTCPHSSPYFLPWHRWYLYYFEQVVRTMSGNPSFTLPYWDYASNVGSSLVLPEAFRDTASPLFESIRGQGFNNPLGSGNQDVPMNSGGYMP
jgi:tyrosinase